MAVAADTVSAEVGTEAAGLKLGCWHTALSGYSIPKPSFPEQDTGLMGGTIQHLVPGHARQAEIYEDTLQLPAVTTY